MNNLWATSKKIGDNIKLAGGFYCGKITINNDIINDSIKDNDIILAKKIQSVTKRLYDAE